MHAPVGWADSGACGDDFQVRCLHTCGGVGLQPGATLEAH